MKVISLLICLLAANLFAQDSARVTIDMTKMRTYYMVLLYKGPNHALGSKEEVAKIQSGHLKNILKLQKEGKLILAGPFMDDSDLRGIFLLNVKDEAEAIAVVSTDPAIQAGRLRAEIKPWMSRKGIRIVDEP